jgi:beta-lactamase superfamily II metal-dependent hydrolase
MKKILALVLMLTLVLSVGLVGCGKEKESASSEAEKSSTTTSDEQTSETTSEIVSDAESSEEASEESSEEVPEKKPTYLYQISPDKCMLMNCYVIKTSSDKLIVIDGGGVATREKTSGYLYKELQRISGKDVPEIEAWFLSHLHDDHVTEFCIIGKDENKPIKVNKIYCNFPEYEYFEKVESAKFAYLYKDVETAYDNMMGEGEFAKCGGKTAFEGDVITIDNVTFEIMLTYKDDPFPIRINDTSMIFRATAEGQSILFLGDAHLLQGEQLLMKYGMSIKSDMVQMSHHGQGGVSEDVYKAINPTACLWPSPDWVFDDWNGNLTTFQTRQWMEDLGVKYHFITGRYKTQQIELPVDFSKLPPISISVPKK